MNATDYLNRSARHDRRTVYGDMPRLRAQETGKKIEER